LTLAALNCSPEFQSSCRSLIRKAYFFEKSAANTPVFAAMLIHMNGRIYDPLLGRMLQADPFIQFPTNAQSYNRYSYVLNNPLAYTDPSGYFSFKDVIKVAAVVAISVATYGAVDVFVGNYVFGSMVVPMMTGAQITAAMNTAAIVGGIAGGAAAGFAAGTSIAAFSGASLGDSFKAGVSGAFAGAISGGFGAYGSSFGAFGRIASAAAGGCGAGKASGGSCKTGATYAGMAAALTVALENWSSYRVTASTAKSGAVVKDIEMATYSDSASHMGIGLVAPKDSGLVGLSVDSLSPSQLERLQGYNPELISGSVSEGFTFSGISEASSLFQRITRYLPGANGASVQHDFQASYFNLGPLMTKATIPLSFYLSYEAMGVRNYMYMADNLKD
jgi:RHS repeat-associated protein